MENGIYEMEVVCKNCGDTGTAKIPERMLVDDFVKLNECPNCGCHTRTKKEWTK